MRTRTLLLTIILGVPLAVTSLASGLAAINNDCTEDVTTQLQTWINDLPDESTITFPHQACYLVNSTLQIHDRNNITINGNNSTIKATSLIPQRTNRAQIHILGGSRITLRNLTLQGVNTTPAYNENYEWDHNLNIEGTQNVLVENVNFRNAYGDAVHNGPDGRRVHDAQGNGAIIPRNVTIRDSTVDTTGRMAFSCTACNKMTVNNTTINNIGYHAFDLEVEASAWHGRNIRFTNNTLGYVYLSMFANGSGSGADLQNITISGNKQTQWPRTCERPVQMWSDTRRRNVTVTNNELYTLATAMTFARTDKLTVKQNYVQFGDGGCGHQPGAISNSDATDTTITGNDLAGGGPITNFRNVTDQHVCGNRTEPNGLFNQPELCSP